MTEAPRSPLRPADDAVRRTARTLLGEAGHAVLACIDPDTGAPAASRVLVATDIGGDPVLLVSRLARHTAALLRDRRASLLIGDVAEGDPLSQSRMTLDGDAEEITRSHEAFSRVRRRFLAHHPAASVYADFADFVWLRIHIRHGSLVAGFARAYRLEEDDIRRPDLAVLIAEEGELVARLNRRFGESIGPMLSLSDAAARRAWQIVTLDADGFEAATDDSRALRRVRRVEFARRVETEVEIVEAFDQLTRATIETRDPLSGQGL